MRELWIDLILHIAGLVAYASIATILAVVGLFIEYHSYLYLSAGDTKLAAWIALLGFVALAAAVLVIRDKVTNSALSLRALFS